MQSIGYLLDVMFGCSLRCTVGAVLATFVFLLGCDPCSSYHGGDRRKSDYVFYIAAVELEWDYAPSGSSQVYDNDTNAEFYIKRIPGRIGSKYKKAVFREYTDSSFTTRKPHPEYLGVLGPILWTEEQKKISIHFKNMASRPYSINVHGGLLKDESKTKYNAKKYEGALYDDGTQASFKYDDSVPPGGEYTYVYQNVYRDGPSIYEDTCAPWIYQSHVDAVRDVESGLIGVIMVCRNEAFTVGRQYGMMRERSHQFDRNFTLLWKIFDENLSWYIDENIEKFADKSLVDMSDADFRQSNRMHAANGYVFGNMPNITVCKDDYVGWFVVSYGSRFDVHSVVFSGHNLVYYDEREAMLNIYPLQSASSRMRAVSPGTWMIRCAMHEHYKAGMQAFFTVKICNSTNDTADSVPIYNRLYFIAAEEVEWDYAPSGYDQLSGRKLTEPGTPSAEYFSRENGNLGGKYKKVRYVEYTDASFSVKKVRDQSEEHLGLLGPVIKCAYNDKIRVLFKNMASRAYSIHAEGVLYDKASEGMLYNDGTSGADKADDAVPPGGTHAYIWKVPQKTHRLGLYLCRSWIYHSAVDPVRDIHSGLVGTILVCHSDALGIESNKQTYRNREFYLHFNVIDESQSWYVDENIQKHSSDASSVDKNSLSFKKSSLKHNINGYMYSNLPKLVMGCKTENNAIHLLSTGGQHDSFTVQFYGENLDEMGKSRLNVPLQPGLSRTMFLIPYNEGEWPIKSGRFSFSEAGMTAKYEIANCSFVNETQIKKKIFNHFYNLTGLTRTFYIAAVELDWNYAPSDYHIVTGERLSIPSSPGYKYVTRENNRLGSKYKKVVYREYEDETFTKMKERAPSEAHMGILGPVIKGGVGDTVKVVFKNLASRDYSIHPVGIITRKEDDGERYEGGAGGDTKLDDAVAPGNTHTYEWFLPRWSARDYGKGLKCTVFVYHSAVNPVRDVHSGLVGPLYVCPTNFLDVNFTRDWPSGDNDFEYFLLFAVFDENQSWYFDDNAHRFARDYKKLNTSDANFIESNKMHAINGYIFGNVPGMTQTMLSWTDFHLMSVGNQDDIHVAQISNTILETEEWRKSSRRMDGVPLYPGASVMVFTHKIRAMVPANWLIRCAIGEHFEAGMMAMWKVTNPFEHLLNLRGPTWWDRLSGIKKAGMLISLVALFFGLVGCVRKIFKKR